MRTRPTWVLVMVGGFLAFNLVQAILHGGRWPWISVALLALLLAYYLWQRRRRPPPPPR